MLARRDILKAVLLSPLAALAVKLKLPGMLSTAPRVIDLGIAKVETKGPDGEWYEVDPDIFRPEASCAAFTIINGENWRDE